MHAFIAKHVGKLREKQEAAVRAEREFQRTHRHLLRSIIKQQQSTTVEAETPQFDEFEDVRLRPKSELQLMIESGKADEYYCSVPKELLSDEETKVDSKHACFQRASDRLAGSKRRPPGGQKDFGFMKKKVRVNVVESKVQEYELCQQEREAKIRKTKKK